MSIRVHLTGNVTLGGPEIQHYTACDHCGQPVTKDTPANLESEWEEGANAFVVHKACSREFAEARKRDGKPRLLWAELVELAVRVK